MWKVGGGGGGERGRGSMVTVVFFFFSLQFLDTPPPSPLIQPGDCQTKTRHSNLKI